MLGWRSRYRKGRQLFDSICTTVKQLTQRCLLRAFPAMYLAAHGTVRFSRGIMKWSKRFPTVIWGSYDKGVTPHIKRQLQHLKFSLAMLACLQRQLHQLGLTCFIATDESREAMPDAHLHGPCTSKNTKFHPRAECNVCRSTSRQWTLIEQLNKSRFIWVGIIYAVPPEICGISSNRHKFPGKHLEQQSCSNCQN